MDRRKSVRKSVDCEAFLCGPSGEKFSCRIEDYCHEGALLRLGSDQSRHAISLFDTPELPMRLTFANAKQTNWHELAIKLVRVDESALGVRFDKPSIKAYETLEGIAGGREPEPFPLKHTAIFEHLRDMVQIYVGPKLSQSLPKWLEDIRGQAVSASTDVMANEIMAIAERLETHIEYIEATVMDLIGVIDESDDESGIQDVSQIESLTLVDKVEFEDWLNARVLTTKIETAHMSLLLQLKMRMESLGFDKVITDTIGPSGLVNAFQSAIRPVQANASVEKQLFRHFELDICLKLQELYKGLNQYLIDQNVLPDLDYSKHLGNKRRRPITPRSSEKSNGDSVPEQPDADQVQGRPDNFKDLSAPFSRQRQSEMNQNQAMAQDIYKGFMNLMTSLSRMGGESAGQGEIEQPAGPQWTYNDMRGPLNQLQSSPVQYGESEPKRRLLDRVLDRLNATDDAAKSISNEQREAIDVVDRFFDSLKANPRLSLDAKNQLLALEVPVLKALMNNETLFEEEENAVQGVMNRIARLGAHGKKIHVGSRKRVSAVVQKITDDFEDDTEIFDDALDELDNIIEREDGLYKKNVERAAAAADGVQRVQQAKMDVGRTLNDRLGQAPVPKVVASLVENGWRDLMQLTHIRHGLDSEEWDELLVLLDTLIDVGSGKDINADVREVVATVHDKLKSLSGDRDVSKALMEELSSLSAANDSPEFVDPIIDDHVIQADKEADPRQIPDELIHWIEVAKTIELGTWMMSHKPDADVQYIRLVWVSAAAEKFVFVNHQGLKVVELSVARLAMQLRDGTMCPDYDYETPIVNQGLDDMVRNVYDKLAAKSAENTQKPFDNENDFFTHIRELVQNAADDQPCVMAMVGIQTDSDSPQVKASVERELVKFAQGSVKGSATALLSDSEMALFVIDDMPEGWQTELHKRLQCLLFELDHHDLTLNAGHVIGQAHVLDLEKMVSQARESMAREETQQAEQSQLDKEPMKSVRTEEDGEGQPLLLSFDAAPINLEDIMVYAQTVEPLKEHLGHLKHAEAHVCSADSLVLIDPQTESEARRIDDWWVHELTRPLYQDIFIKRYRTIRLRISGYALNTHEWMERLEAVMNAEQFEPSTVWFEIYHCSGISNLRFASDIISRLSTYGFKFCLDLASENELPFNLVKNLPVAAIKIEQGWVDQSGLAEETSKPLIEIIHYLGKQVIACGVDSAISLQKMKKLGVDFVQGATIGEIDQIRPKYDQI